MTAPKRKTPKETPEEAILRATEARRLARIEGARRLPPDKRRPQPRAEEKPNYTVRTPDGATWDEHGRPVWQWLRGTSAAAECPAPPIKGPRAPATANPARTSNPTSKTN
jgi:hypothetical protein